MSSPMLLNIQSQFILYGYSTVMILGNIGNALVIIVLGRQRENACSIYLFTSAAVNMIYLTFYGFIQIFPVNYSNVTPTALALCKTYTYMTSIIGQVGKTLLVLACIDRFLITHERVAFRTFSTPQRAKYFIIFSIILWILLGIHLPIMVTIVNGQCAGAGVYATIRTIYILIYVGLLPPILLGIFGYLTYRHMRQVHIRVQPIANTTGVSIQQRDRNLLKLVIYEILVYVITAGPFPSIFLEMMISQYVLSKKSIQYIQIEVFLLNIASFLLYINSAASFYTYMIASKTFRRDLKTIIINSYHQIRSQPIAPLTSGINETPIQQEIHD